MENSYVLQMKNPLFLDLSLWFWGMSECEPGHSVGPEVRPNYVIHCVLDGKGYFEVGEKHFDIKKGQGFLIEPPQFCRYFWNTITRKPVFIRLPRFFYFIFMSCFDCERRRNVL